MAFVGDDVLGAEQEDTKIGHKPMQMRTSLSLPLRLEHLGSVLHGSSAETEVRGNHQ